MAMSFHLLVRSSGPPRAHWGELARRSIKLCHKLEHPHACGEYLGAGTNYDLGERNIATRVGRTGRRKRRCTWGDLTKGKINRAKDSVTLGNDERSRQAIRQSENPEEKKVVGPGLCVKRAVIKSWRVFYWPNRLNGP
jgi:hypothetical protein